MGCNYTGTLVFERLRSVAKPRPERILQTLSRPDRIDPAVFLNLIKKDTGKTTISIMFFERETVVNRNYIPVQKINCDLTEK